MRCAIPVVLVALLVGCATSTSEECPAGMWPCTGVCTDVMNDHAHCGSCGAPCPEGQICESGVCVLSCPEGTSECGGVCRDLGSDSYNCGSCGLSCATGYVCSAGACVTDCPEGYTDCSGTCKNLDNDPSNCGDCANVCAAGEVCSASACSFTCPAPYTDCSGSCADLSTDHLNCGSCSNACAGGQICSAGSCVTSCYEGLTMCSGACRDLMRDPLNCGSCGTACSTGEVCYDGACTAACPGGFTDCSGSCRDLDSDRLSCGACDSPCADGHVCESGTCTVMCVAPLVDCSGVCSDTRYDPANCGSCGARCSSTEACVSGTCRPTASRTVLVYYQSFSTSTEPAERAATLLGWTVTATSNGSTFASSYDAGGWGVVVIDAPGSGLPAEVRTRVLDRITAGRLLIFSWWDLDTDGSLASSLGVSTTSYSPPHDVYPTSGASINFFTSGTSVPVPLTSSHDAGDNGDFLTLTAGGQIIFSADSPTGSGLGAITNSGATIVLGFLPWDYQDTDDDGDGTPDMTELFMNLLRY